MSTTNNLKNSESNVIVGLGAYTHVCANTSMYFVDARSSVNPASSVIITIAQSGSVTDSVSSAAPAATQNNIELRKVFNCTAGDVLTVTMSSAAAIDNQLNNVKTIVSMHSGQD